MIVRGRKLAVAAAVLVVLGGLAGGFVWLRATTACEEVTVGASDDKSAFLQQLAGEYDHSGRIQGGRCLRARVVAMNPIDAQRYFASPTSWPGPALDVWSPASSAGLNLLNVPGQGGAGLLPAQAPSLFLSPLVIAVPETGPRLQSWRDLVGLRHAELNPSTSTSGLDALVAMQAAGGHDLIAALQPTVDHYGAGPDAFLNAQRDADFRGTTYLAALVLDEQAVIAYDKRSPRTRLVPVLPREGTVLADHPYAVLTSSPHQAAARDFYAYLTDARRQAAITAEGYRPRGSPVQGSVVAPPGHAALQGLLVSWRALRKPGRILVMADAGADATPGIAAQLAQALTGLQPRDQLAVWYFPPPVPRTTFGPAGTGQIQILQSLPRTQGAPHLEAALTTALSGMGSGYDPRAINAVVLLEPRPPETLDDALVSLLRNQRSGDFVELFTIGPRSPVLAALALAGRGGDYRPGDSAQLLVQVISNF